MIDRWPELRQTIYKHWRPLVFGLTGVLLLSGIVWLDSALSNSQFTEVFVGETNEPEGTEQAEQLPPTAQQQLELAKAEAQELLEQERLLAERAENSSEAQKSEIASMLDQWISSWAAKDIATYLSFYSENFDTPFDISLEEWAGSRIRRIETPRWIRVQLEQVDFVQLEEGFAALSVTQLYATPGYADRTRKHIDLVREEQGWKIVREDSVETVRLDQ